MPIVSIIMPAYQAGRFIRDSVESVLAQTFQDWELIAVDDCSQDETGEILRAYSQKDPRIRYLRNEKNMGSSATRHRAISQSRGEWLAFLDSDDLWQPEKLERQLAVAKQTGAEFLFTASGFIDETGNAYGFCLHVPERITYRQLCKHNVISNSSVLIRRELFCKYEIVADGIHEDYACWLNVTRNGYEAIGLDTPLLIYRLSSGSKSSNKFKAARMNWRTYRTLQIPFVASLCHMVCYTMAGLRKYRHFVRK